MNMEFGHLFEAIMLVCFGFSWPLNVIKAYKARTAKGTSLAFIILIITGYVAGISAKFINKQFNYVLVVYFLNLIIVMTNVVVYIRNVRLDKKNGVAAKIAKENEDKKSDFTYSQEENLPYEELNDIAKTNSVILMGGTFAKQIPVAELAQSFEFNFDIYNRSEEKLSVKNAKNYFEKNIAPIYPEGVIVQLGEDDVSLFKSNSADFDKYYIDLLSTISGLDKNTRIALVSVFNPTGNDIINKMNAHIKALAESANCPFVNLDDSKLWTPKATKAATDFAESMGLKEKKPLLNVAEIIYSYACLEESAAANTTKVNLVG